MKTASAKGKGRRLQQWVVGKLRGRFRDLEDDDFRSTSMGVSGEDVQLSPAARKVFPHSIECKSRARFAVYDMYGQACDNCPVNCEPILVIKGNRKDPLVVVDAEWFFKNYGKDLWVKQQ